ncbi:OLC1v1006622C1 [Oldenlandia corymbosa var. corymbosa]|uniref:OLC1v1006622C1 n=1 Tax=Oldenlandia corymbosa var. corymbosa TaxID=529605 RepID=A0AAV1DKH2_OLDCO|nr:OLC1v1006622C1 [Oldenlandia corymbosa var. corymbosa]
MEEYYFNVKRGHIPAFGSWDCNNDLPFTQCFESATQAGLLRYSYSEDRDLYVAGDLYQNDVVTPAMIVVPRRRVKSSYQGGKEAKGGGEAWVVCDCENGVTLKAPPSPLPPSPPRRAPKAVDEDLYKISPELLRAKPRKKSGWRLFSSCLVPSCV